MNDISRKAGALITSINLIKEAASIAIKQGMDNEVVSKGETEASKLLSNSGGAGLLDFLGTSWGHARAGRATTLAKAMDQDPTYAVSDPIKSDLLHTGGGVLGGGLLGAIAGAGVGGAFGSDRGSAGTGAAVGGLAGAALGGLGLGSYNSYNRMDKIRKIRKDYVDSVNNKRKLNLDAADPRLTSAGAFLINGGQHRGGSADAYSHLTGGGTNESPFRDMNRAMHYIPGLNYITPFGDFAEGLGASQTVEESNERRRRNERK